MRLAVFLIAGAEIALFVYVALTQTTGGDAAGNAMAQGFVAVAGMALAVLLAPALILAVTNRALKVAFGLAVLPFVLTLLLLAI